jgi:HxlR-like helix-turn-helix
MMASAEALVVDASVVVKWYLADEEYHEQASLLLPRVSSGLTTLVAPMLLRYEVPAVIVQATRRNRLTPAAAHRAVEEFLDTGTPVQLAQLVARRCRRGSSPLGDSRSRCHARAAVQHLDCSGAEETQRCLRPGDTGSLRRATLGKPWPQRTPRTAPQPARAIGRDGVLPSHTPEIPPRVGYELTEKGRDVLPIVDALRAHGSKWLRQGRQQPEGSQ